MTLSYGISVFRQIDALFNPYMLFSVYYVPMWFVFKHLERTCVRSYFLNALLCFYVFCFSFCFSILTT